MSLVSKKIFAGLFALAGLSSAVVGGYYGLFGGGDVSELEHVAAKHHESAEKSKEKKPKPQVPPPAPVRPPR